MLEFYSSKARHWQERTVILLKAGEQSKMEFFPQLNTYKQFNRFPVKQIQAPPGKSQSHPESHVRRSPPGQLPDPASENSF